MVSAPNEQPSTSSVAGSLDCNYFSGYGEVNEVRGVVQRVLGSDSTEPAGMDDVEVVYTDASYIPLLYEFFAENIPADIASGQFVTVGSPVTFAEGNGHAKPSARRRRR